MTETTSASAPERSKLVRKAILTFVGAAGVAIGITLLFYGMRSVMEIGGSCASGNVPYEISRPCPDGVAGVMVGGIFGGLIALGIYACNALGPNLTVLAWPALFLSLGWNFLEYGVDPPGAGGGPAFGWLIPGVLFLAMGGVPLVVGLTMLRSSRATRRAERGAGAEPTATASSRWNTYAMGWVLQIVALGFGIWAGIQLFESATGTTITFG